MKECSIGDGVGNEGAGMEVPPNSLEWDHQHRSGEEEPLVERRKEMLSVSCSLSLSIKESESASFITIIVCLVGILLSVPETGLCRKYSQNKCSKFQKPL